MSAGKEIGDDITRVRLSTLLNLSRHAAGIALVSNNIKAYKSGGFVSALRGRGMAFHESRLYQPGDDIRAIDWRVTARTGRTYTKVYQEERERPVLLWVDLQQSMFFGTRHYYKSVLASQLAALLAWGSVLQGDRLGGLVFAEHDHCEARPKRGRAAALHFLQQLANHAAWQQSIAIEKPTADSGYQALSRLRQVARPGSLIVLISDCRFLDNKCRMQLTQIAQHNDVILLFIHDPFEQTLPPSGYYRLTDGHQTLMLDSARQANADQYQKRFHQRVEYLQQLCHQPRFSLIDISTADDMLAKLKDGLGSQRFRRRE